MKTLCVFCGSSMGHDPLFQAAARELGLNMAHRGIRLVYGGARIGLMGALADSVLVTGGKVVGVMPQALVEKEVAHQNLTELRIVQSMHERKELMYRLSDAFLVLPGGYGTLDEMFEIITWKQIGHHLKPIALLNVGGYFDKLTGFITHARESGLANEPTHFEGSPIAPFFQTFKSVTSALDFCAPA